MKIIGSDRRPTGHPSPQRSTTWGLYRSTTWEMRRSTTWGWSRVSRTRAPSPLPRGGGAACAAHGAPPLRGREAAPSR